MAHLIVLGVLISAALQGTHDSGTSKLVSVSEYSERDVCRLIGINPSEGIEWLDMRLNQDRTRFYVFAKRIGFPASGCSLKCGDEDVRGISLPPSVTRNEQLWGLWLDEREKIVALGTTERAERLLEFPQQSKTILLDDGTQGRVAFDMSAKYFVFELGNYLCIRRSSDPTNNIAKVDVRLSQMKLYSQGAKLYVFGVEEPVVSKERGYSLVALTIDLGLLPSKCASSQRIPPSSWMQSKAQGNGWGAPPYVLDFDPNLLHVLYVEQNDWPFRSKIVMYDMTSKQFLGKRTLTGVWGFMGVVHHKVKSD